METQTFDSIQDHSPTGFHINFAFHLVTLDGIQSLNADQSVEQWLHETIQYVVHLDMVVFFFIVLSTLTK